mmetsp:Transcript_2600/g.5386  ORF Transcript_2600/g.5386 Transcript_2600/m.5386 type:complete len:82 (+) Transcript_2600:202-447(+)
MEGALTCAKGTKTALESTKLSLSPSASLLFSHIQPKISPPPESEKKSRQQAHRNLALSWLKLKGESNKQATSQEAGTCASA